MDASRRLEERLKATLNLELESGSKGLTRDISPGGVFFWSMRPFNAGDPVDFSVHFDDRQADRHWTLHCKAEVLRVENGSARWGVAARILDTRLDTDG